MQALSLRHKRGFSASRIYLISQQRMMNMCHMDTDLMCSSCFKTTLHIGILPESLENLAVGHSLLPVASHSHTLPILGIPSQGSIYSEFIFRNVVVQNGKIAPHDTVLLKLGCDAVMGCVVLADYHASGGVSVNPVDDAGAHHAVDTGEAVAAVVQNCIYECA